MTSSDQPIRAMAFYHDNGMVPAFKQAFQFTGEGGRIATIPDIIAARLATESDTASWGQYFTTLSAEYVGIGKNGKPIVIVAHGIGPMATLDGILAAYGHEYKDKTRDLRGGRIPQEVFLKLENGDFGEVDVVDLEAVWARRPYQFSGHAVTLMEIAEEPLWKARLGKQWEDYCDRHQNVADTWSEEQGKDNGFLPCILAMDGASNCSYSTREMFEHWMKETPDTAICHLLSISQLSISSHQYWGQDYNDCQYLTSLVSDVDCHEWSNGTRLVGIRGNEPIADIHPGAHNIAHLRDVNWKALMRPSRRRGRQLYAVRQLPDETWFTRPSHRGSRMASFEPEFQITDIEPVGEPMKFVTQIVGYHGFFRYSEHEVRRMRPILANAYQFVRDPQISSVNPDTHVCTIQFYRAEVDTSKVVMKSDELREDLDLTLQLLGIDPAA